MSTRGTNFLHQWIKDNLSDIESADIISVADLVQKLFADAKAGGILSYELDEDSGSVYQVVLEAIIHNKGRAGHRCDSAVEPDHIRAGFVNEER